MRILYLDCDTLRADHLGGGEVVARRRRKGGRRRGDWDEYLE